MILEKFRQLADWLVFFFFGLVGFFFGRQFIDFEGGPPSTFYRAGLKDSPRPSLRNSENLDSPVPRVAHMPGWAGAYSGPTHL